jgi:hypothetical protein
MATYIGFMTVVHTVQIQLEAEDERDAMAKLRLGEYNQEDIVADDSAKPYNFHVEKVS